VLVRPRCPGHGFDFGQPDKRMRAAGWRPEGATSDASRFTQPIHASTHLRSHRPPSPRDTSDESRATSHGLRRRRFVSKKAPKRDFVLDKTSHKNTLSRNSDAHSYCVQTVRGLTGYEAWMLCVCLEQGLLSPLISKRLVRPPDVRMGRNPSDSWVARTHPW
jgi:hypothetical protein